MRSALDLPVLTREEWAASRPASSGCFGLPGWVMVHRDRGTRHPIPLRLGAEDTDAVAGTHPVRCSHCDAFRCSTPEAVGRNRRQPTRESQPEPEQPGCLHAGVDLSIGSACL